MKQSEVLELFDQYVKVIKNSSYPPSAAEIAEHLGGYVDTLINFADVNGGVYEDVCSRAEWIKESGLCPDGGDLPDHFYGRACAKHECPTYLEEQYERSISGDY